MSSSQQVEKPSISSKQAEEDSTSMEETSAPPLLVVEQVPFVVRVKAESGDSDSDELVEQKPVLIVRSSLYCKEEESSSQQRSLEPPSGPRRRLRSQPKPPHYPLPEVQTPPAEASILTNALNVDAGLMAILRNIDAKLGVLIQLQKAAASPPPLAVGSLTTSLVLI